MESADLIQIGHRFSANFPGRRQISVDLNSDRRLMLFSAPVLIGSKGKFGRNRRFLAESKKNRRVEKREVRKVLIRFELITGFLP